MPLGWSIPAFFDELEKLGGVPVVSTHREAREHLRRGDVITMSPQGGKGLGDRAFGAASKVLQGNLTHSAIYIGAGNVVESRLGEGVTKKKLMEALRSKSYVIQRPDVPYKIRNAAASFARKQVGKSYDDVALMTTGAGTLVPNKVTRRVNRGKKEPPTGSEKFMCSDLVNAAYAKAKLVKGRKHVAPVDLRTSPAMKTVAKRLERGFKEKGPLVGRARKSWQEKTKTEAA